MHIHITPRHLKLTAAIHGYVADKIEHLEHVTDQIIGAHVVLWYDKTRVPSKQFCVKVHLAVPGPDIHAEDVEADLYAAVDKVVDKLSQQLRKRKTSLNKRFKRTARLTKEHLRKFGN
ncbi:MAG: ribosome hibernation-promoting factor, HPF/YfiA family [Verrucomicrobiota bacterium]